MITREVCRDASGNIDTITFHIKQGNHYGKLYCPHDSYIYYDAKTDTWSGEEINADGWVYIPTPEVDYIRTTCTLDVVIAAIINLKLG